MTWLFTYNGVIYGNVNISHWKLFNKNDQCSSLSGEDRLKMKVFNQSAPTSLSLLFSLSVSLCFSLYHSHMSLNGKGSFYQRRHLRPTFSAICVFMCAYIAPLAVNEKTSFRYHLTTTERNSVHSDSWLWLTTHITSFNSDPFTIIGSLWCARRQTEDRVTHKVFLLKEWIISKWDMKLASYNIHHMHVVIIYRDKRA